jgi:hypothetical protein
MPETNAMPKLDKPGAGLPLLESLYVRWYLGPFVAARADWDKDSEAFNALGAKILKTVEGLGEEDLSRRVLVPKQRGLEDSSRYWSAAMALEHMVIVGEGQKKIVIALANNIVPDLKVDTGKVKPAGGMPAAETVSAFRALIATAEAEIARAAKDRDSKARLHHPWFGPINARQWHWLMQAHLRIHLNQIRAIVSQLKSPQG